MTIAMIDFTRVKVVMVFENVPFASLSLQPKTYAIVETRVRL
jgi:hypothetical protein